MASLNAQENSEGNVTVLVEIENTSDILLERCQRLLFLLLFFLLFFSFLLMNMDYSMYLTYQRNV